MASITAASPYPSVDRVAQFAEVSALVTTYGRSAVIDAIRAVLGHHRAQGSAADDV